MFILRDPGPCPVDDTPHTTCCAPTFGPGPLVVIVQLPARDGVIEPPLVGSLSDPPPTGAAAPPPLAKPVTPALPPGHFSTASYRRKAHKER
jgi:hypothetical protein